MPQMKHPRVLLTSVCRPFGGDGEGDSVGAELFHMQVTRAQGPFSLRQTIRVWGLDFIAENISAPSTTLHYPELEELEEELKRHEYTHVGINFVVPTFHKVRQMVPMIRRLRPNATIVLGGYGTVLTDEALTPYADAICREEGVGFMRELLGEPREGPIRQPHTPIPSARVLSYQRDTVVGHVTAGLGCTNGCDFCSTSHFYKQKYVPFLETGRDIYEAMMATRKKAEADGSTMKGYILIDEDFFIHKKRALQFLDCVREGGEALSIMGFGSVRGLSQFTGKQIASMGFDLVWNAFEGAESGYTKQKGRPLPELYQDLKDVGTATLTSMIIGFPYQDEAIMRAEFEALMELQPGMMQCLIYSAFPGTPFHEQVVEERRYLPQYGNRPDLRRWDGFAMHFDHPKFDDPKRIEAIQKELYQRDYERLGPSIVRMADVWLNGYENLRNDDDPLLAARARRLGQEARGVLPALSAAVAFGPSLKARSRARRVRERIIRLTGAVSASERVLEAASPAMYLLDRAATAADAGQQPGLLRVQRGGGRGASASTTTADALDLQGKRLAGAVGGVLQRLWGAPVRGPQRFPLSWPDYAAWVTQRAAPVAASLRTP